MKWFRFYSEFIDDPKIAMMNDSDQLLWVKALCLASEGKIRGVIELSDEEICWKLRITLETWKHAIDKFRAKGMIEHSKMGYEITNWAKRQFESDSSAERVKRHRAKKRRKRLATKEKQLCNVTVTPPDTDPDTDPDNYLGSYAPTGSYAREDFSESLDDDQPRKRTVDDPVNLSGSKRTPWAIGNGVQTDPGYLQHLVRNYLPKVPHYEGRKIDLSDAMMWLSSAPFDESRLAKATLQWQFYQTTVADELLLKELQRLNMTAMLPSDFATAYEACTSDLTSERKLEYVQYLRSKHEHSAASA